MIHLRSIYFVVLLVVFLVALMATAGYYYARYRQRQKYPYGNWETLLKRLTLIDRDNVALIARDFVDESGNRRTDEDEYDLEPSQIWPLIGGLKGLEDLEHNCAVLVDLAFFVQQWYPEALLVAEELRLNAREIEWHLGRLRGADKNGKLHASFADNAQRVVEIYYVMTRRVLTLYEQCNPRGLADLQRAL